MGSFRYFSGYVPFYKPIISFLFPSATSRYFLERFPTKLLVTFLENGQAGYNWGVFSFLFFKQFFFYILIIFDFSRKTSFSYSLWSLYIKRYVKMLYEGDTCSFSTHYFTVLPKIYCTLKIKVILNLKFWSSLVFCNWVILGGHIIYIYKTIFLKLIFYLRLSCQVPEFALQGFYLHLTSAINHCF